MLHMPVRIQALARLLVLQAVTMAIVGCGASAKPQGKISGKVSFQGNPVTAGEINLFQKSTGTAVTAPLDSSGNFTVPVPMDTGTYSISIIPPRPKQLPPGTPPEELPPFPVPIKYQDPAQSDLTKEVTKGDNKLEIVIPG
jgi:hypothetical protein